MKCYLDSKLCQVTSLLTLERVLKTEGANVHCYAVHPGMINVDLFESIGFGAILGNLICRVSPVFKTCKKFIKVYFDG